jgi:hypothetical protein
LIAGSQKATGTLLSEGNCPWTGCNSRVGDVDDFSSVPECRFGVILAIDPLDARHGSVDDSGKVVAKVRRSLPAQAALGLLG